MWFKQYSIWGFILLFFLLSSRVNAIGVQPLVIELDLRPGGNGTFELTFLPDEEPRTVKLSICRPAQLLSGGLVYKEADPEINPEVTWIELEAYRVDVFPDTENKLKGQINIPYDAAGSYNLAVMVEPVTASVQAGITFGIRYAVHININVTAPRLRPGVDVLDLEFIAPGKEDFPVIIASVYNPIALSFPISGEVIIRDAERRLVERVAIKSQIAWQTGRAETKIYPKTEVQLWGPVKETLPPGEYELRLLLRYADGKQKIISQPVTVERAYLSEKKDCIKWEPPNITAWIHPGGAASSVLEIQNKTGEPLFVELAIKEIRTNYARSVFQSMEVLIKGDQMFVLDSGRIKRLGLFIRSPREVKQGGYYGYLAASVISEDGETIESHLIPVNLFVGTDWEYKAKVLSIEYDDFADRFLFSVLVRNLSSSHIKPTGTLKVKDRNGVAQKALSLELTGAEGVILPEKDGFLVADTSPLEPGKYVVVVEIVHEGEEIETAEFLLSVTQGGVSGEKDL